MAVRLRMTRKGGRGSPFYRIIAADVDSPRDGRFLEQLGTYDPRVEPAKVTLKMDRVEHWLSQGATATLTVGQIISRHKKAASA